MRAALTRWGMKYERMATTAFVTAATPASSRREFTPVASRIGAMMSPVAAWPRSTGRQSLVA